MRLELDPAAAESHAAVPLVVAQRCDEVMDWIEQDDPLRRHMTRRCDVGVVRHIGEVTSLGG